MFSINSMRDAELHNVHLVKSSVTGKLKVTSIKHPFLVTIRH